MSNFPAFDQELVQRLPLPLAQLYRRAHSARTPLERHQGAFFLWEAAVKLLGSVAVVAYAEQSEQDPQVAERLQNLARPALGHWWEFIRRFVPVLADRGDPGFAAVRDLLLGRARDDLPRAAGLDAALREDLEGRAETRVRVRLSELFDRLVMYRNRFVTHGAPGQRPERLYEQMGAAILGGVSEILGRLDVLAGGRLLYLAEVRRLARGQWQMERYQLAGEAALRLEPLEFPEAEFARLPPPDRVYREAPSGTAALLALHPLVVYDADGNSFYFWNARRGRRSVELLCYTTGQVLRRDLEEEQRTLLARALGTAPAEGQGESGAALSQAGEAPSEPGTPARRMIGEFELLSEVGRGGMGIVYRAWQPSLGRPVALKALLRTGDAKAEARFAREIRALGRVEHPNLVKIFTSGNDGELWYYTMEMIEGTTLAAVCNRLQAGSAHPAAVDLPTWRRTVVTVSDEARRAERSINERGQDGPASPSPVRRRAETVPERPRIEGNYVRHAVELIRQVAGAAHALHEAGAIHRDIKPGNIMVTADGEQAVLMDLGLVQLADDVQALTRTRQFVGTLRYASPQQLLAADRIDRRTDVYSLGATLWELLALRPLYGASAETPAPELMERIQLQEPERPSKYHPGIPRDLEAVVLKCLEKDPARRYATAHELAEDLRRWLADEGVQARPPTVAARLSRFLRRRWREVAFASLASYGAVATLLLIVRSWVSHWAGMLAAVACAGGAGVWLGYRIGFRRRGAAPESPTRARAATGPGTGPPARRARDEAFSSQVVQVYYPAPIALAYRRFCQQGEHQPRARVERLFKAYEATLKYLVLVGVTDLLHCLTRAGGQTRADLLRLLDPPPPKPEKQAERPRGHVFDFLRKPTPMTLGMWVNALRATAKALEQRRDRFIQELPTACRPGSRFDTEVLGWILSQRNLAEHRPGSLALTDDECKQVVRECQKKLHEMLEKVRFVRAYPLGFFERVYRHGSARTAKSRYHVHSCTGVLGATSKRGVSIEVDDPLNDQTPFLVSPDGTRVLYLWPFYAERRAEHTLRHTLYGFETILDDQGRYLTGIRAAAIDSLDPWERTLHEEPQDSFEWLLGALAGRPACQPLPPGLGLADDLLPSRGNLVDRRLGPYLLEARIASGGFATIYSARTPEEELVAVKVLDLQDQEPFQEFVGRFEREFDKLKSAGEDHPGIIRCFERGLGLIDKTDYPYYSMEFADGGDLGARIEERRALLRGKIPWHDDEARAQVIEEFGAILDAVAHLHAAKNFVHRDIKPNNVLVVGGRLRLADFGLAKNLRPSERRLSSAPPGTPFYRAPEQEKGEEVGRPADVYSLGVVLAELFTGTLPEPKTDATEGSTLGQYPDLKKVPDRLREAYANLKKLPEALQELIYRCTDVRPDRRPPDASELKRELDRAVGVAEAPGR